MSKPFRRNNRSRVVDPAVALRSDQIYVHAAEVTALHGNLLEYREGLRSALSLLNAARRGEWTPADNHTLTELRKLVSK